MKVQQMKSKEKKYCTTTLQMFRYIGRSHVDAVKITPHLHSLYTAVKNDNGGVVDGIFKVSVMRIS
jgi:hypothetical protein